MDGRKLHDSGRLNNRMPETTKTPLTDWVLVGGIGLIILAYVMMHDLLGGTLFTHNVWDSYTLQAMAWRDGSTALPYNYDHLELAIYNGNYYVSFPPFPSLIMLPLTYIFGEQTPNNFVIMVITLLCIIFVYLCFTERGANGIHAMFWAVFFVLGSNMMWMSTMGAVWFMAQAMNMLLCMAGIFFAITGKKALSLMLVALAAGCRPFSVCLLFILFIYFIMKDHRRHTTGKTFLSFLRHLPYLIMPVLIGGVYLYYNYIRFGDMLEFGHNYLPEFTGAGNEQFSLSYIPENLFNLFLRPITMDSIARFNFPKFNGFMFYLANPIFLVWFIFLFRDITRRRFSATKGLITVGFILNLLFLAAHKTLGGWQFGARYTVDLIPYVLLYMMEPVKTPDQDVHSRRQRNKSAFQPSTLFLVLGCFALMFNLYGTLHMHFIEEESTQAEVNAVSVFDQQTVEPDEQRVLRAMGDKYQLWNDLHYYVAENYPDATKRWKYFSNSVGWVLEMENNGKSLVTLIPSNSNFKAKLSLDQFARAELWKATLPTEALRYSDLTTGELMVVVENQQGLDSLKELIRIAAGGKVDNPAEEQEVRPEQQTQQAAFVPLQEEQPVQPEAQQQSGQVAEIQDDGAQQNMETQNNNGQQGEIQQAQQNASSQEGVLIPDGQLIPANE